jgi:hypothetical protein
MSPTCPSIMPGFRGPILRGRRQGNLKEHGDSHAPQAHAGFVSTVGSPTSTDINCSRRASGAEGQFLPCAAGSPRVRRIFPEAGKRRAASGMTRALPAASSRLRAGAASRGSRPRRGQDAGSVHPAPTCEPSGRRITPGWFPVCFDRSAWFQQTAELPSFELRTRTTAGTHPRRRSQQPDFVRLHNLRDVDQR